MPELDQISKGLIDQTYHNETFMQILGQIRAEQAHIYTDSGVLFISLFIGIFVLAFAERKTYEHFLKPKCIWDKNKTAIYSLVAGLVIAAAVAIIYCSTNLNALQVQYPDYYLLRTVVYDLWQAMG